MIAFRVSIPPADEDVATALLWELGTAGIEVRAGTGDELALLAYFRDEALEDADLASALALLPRARVEATPLPEVDWVSRFRESFRAFRAGRFLIAPPWDLPRDRKDLLVVEPGRAFGTGTHETTRLCLAALESLAGSPVLTRVLDIGTGTGLLAVAAAFLGARLVAAVDVDPEALDSARLHVRINHAEVRLVRADGGQAFRAGSFDLVLANLTSRLLLERRDEIAALLAPGGALILSGLLVEEAPGLERAFRDVGPVARRTEGDWAALVVQATGP